MPEEKKFLKISWQQVVSAVIVAIFLGIFSWAGATLKSALKDIDDLKDWKTQTETIINTDLKHTIDELRSSISATSNQMGTLSGDVKRIEILANRLDAIVVRLEAKIK
jgi:hypothetical protein